MTTHPVPNTQAEDPVRRSTLPAGAILVLSGLLAVLLLAWLSFGPTVTGQHSRTVSAVEASAVLD